MRTPRCSAAVSLPSIPLAIKRCPRSRGSPKRSRGTVAAGVSLLAARRGSPIGGNSSRRARVLQVEWGRIARGSRRPGRAPPPHGERADRAPPREEGREKGGPPTAQESRLKPRLGPAAKAAVQRPFTGGRRAALKDSLTVASSLASFGRARTRRRSGRRGGIFSPMPRIAIAQLRPVKGEYAANLERLGGVLARVAELDPPVELLITPEGSMSGYFVEGGVRDVAVTAGTLFRDLATPHEAAGAKRSLDVAGGVFEGVHNPLYNSCPFAAPRGPPAGVKHLHP